MNDTVLSEAEAREVARLLRPIINTHDLKTNLATARHSGGREERERRAALQSALVKLAPLATE